MSHTNSTANLSLPQFIGTDKPTWLGDINGAFSAIDAYAGTNDAAVSAAASDASSAIAQSASAVSTANAANTTAGNASTAATNAVGTANNAVAIAGTVDSKVGLLADLTTTDRTSIVNAINEVNAAIGTPTAAQVSYDNTGSGLTATNVQDAIDEVAQGGGGSSVQSVSVTADGVKTNSALLTELHALVPYNDIKVAWLTIDTTRFSLVSQFNDKLGFASIAADSSHFYNSYIEIGSTPIYLYGQTDSAPASQLNNVLTSGIKFTVQYI